ncbi:S1 family peptidase [Actinoplanes teichomyceticus]|uniref:Trypsin n=1 Tax=Actinoplanes teichomyceticus TaxID=1867 RepID=A0A561VL27_ACTTI|nr:trypsin-like serine protease [Actinoplanes teichomyceticus]TWG12325.1 trypsin [Actinoplanes teichomyceticus]GIF14265.1 hypothetical protein Ate01nite_42970 [Actinoplanes teichomyceticus]
MEGQRGWRAVGACLAALAVVLLGATPANAIADGLAVPDGRYGFAVKLTGVDIPVAGGGTRDSSCSGGLVSPHWVLTAGHCFRDTRGNRVARPVARRTVATVGRAALGGSGGHDVRVVAVRQHGSVDVALARLDRAVTDVRPMRVSRVAPKLGARVRLVGYGLIRATARRTPDRLRTGLFRVTSVTRTEIGMSGVEPARTTSACEHDSGGPYFTAGPNGTATVVGVVSHGPDCPHTGADQAGRIDTVAAWITSVIGSDAAPAGARPAPPAAATHAPGFRMPWAAYLGVGFAAVMFCVGLAESRRGRRARSARSRTGSPSRTGSRGRTRGSGGPGGGRGHGGGHRRKAPTRRRR